ncbi:PAS domain-containing sensor histidine kinase [Oligoflexus tunisiensis]|uniref:PAS domain-containing sensor histidine kinase n=1 Tax=Oligoflexus tunisiensis TaxID=708132 RepID=UPI00114D2BCC|nr:ATP-binding protein [Oligoflexus tunisiensis]
MTVIILVLMVLSILSLLYIIRLRRIVNELSEREKAQPGRIQGTESHAQSMLSSMDLGAIVDKSIGIVRFDANHRLVYVNEVFTSMHETVAAESIGKDIAEVLGINSKISAPTLESIKGDEIWKGEIRGQKKNFKNYWSGAVVLPEKDGSGQYKGSLLLLVDITTQKKSSMLSERERRLTGFKQIVKGMAHEINNPLTIISTQAEHLLRRIDSHKLDCDSLAKGLEKILITAMRISKIVQSMNFLSQGDIEQSEINIESIEEVVNAALALNHQRIARCAIDVQIDWGRCQTKTILSHRVGLTHVIACVIENSIDEIVERGIAQPWIRIAMEFITGPMDNDIIRILISDPGNGIDAAYRDHLMEPFFTTRDVGEGKGLGLSFSQHIMELMGGRIYYEDQSVNTTFVLEFPCCSPERQTSKVS